MELFRKNIVALRKGLFNTNKIKYSSSSLSSAASRYSVPTMQAHEVIISHHDSKPVFESSVMFQILKVSLDVTDLCPNVVFQHMSEATMIINYSG